MNNNTDEKKTGESKKQKHLRLKWFGRFVALIILLLVFGALYESRSEVSDARNYPPPGKLVDVGGYRLHIHCTGVGTPTVVIESGWGDSSSSWGWVQPEIAKNTRVCTYDRAGMGWSEMSSEPRTAQEFAKELHTLLHNANETGPYVLVGHSLGGYTVRLYANDYQGEVSGVVFVDPQNISVSETSKPAKTPKPGQSLIPSLIARFGIIRLLKVPLGSIEDLPKGDKEAYTATAVAPRSVQTFIDELMGISEGVSQARAVTTLGSLPLIVLSRGKDMDSESAASQARYIALSTNSEHIIAEQSGHAIMIEQPDAVVSAIMKMVSLVRHINN